MYLFASPRECVSRYAQLGASSALGNVSLVSVLCLLLMMCACESVGEVVGQVLVRLCSIWEWKAMGCWLRYMLHC